MRHWKLSVSNMKEILTLALLILCVGAPFVQAQTVITPLWNDRGFIFRDQLWSCTVINSGPPFTGKIELTVSDANSGSNLFSAIGRDILISNGTKVINSSAIQPASYSSLSSIYAFNATSNMLLPPGIYNVCYKLLKVDSEVVLTVADECKTLESDPLSPPLLTFPENEALLNETRPYFTWLPPVPNSTLSRLNYTLRLVEKRENQSAQEALDRNLPVFTHSGLTSISYNFPIHTPDLDTGKVYAWQIVALNESNYVGTSEAWIFSLKTNAGKGALTTPGYYVPLIKAGSPQVITISNRLNISYNNEANDTSLTFSFGKHKLSTNPTLSVDTVNLSLKPGVNNISIDIARFGSLKPRQVYEVYLHNSRKEKWWLYFLSNGTDK